MRVDLKDVEKRFGKVAALRGVSAAMPSGSRVALIGPNGSGKSTLIRALLGLIECDGEVLLEGRSPYAERERVARQLAYVPQIAPQLSATVEELVRTICVTRELDPAVVANFALRLDLDVRAIRRQPFRNLSGGMKQKLLIACAFAASPKLLVLDEPTASLDARARDRFFRLCDELPRTTTIVLCSHRLEELEELATDVLALEDGRVAWQGPAQARTADGSDRRVVELLLEQARSPLPPGEAQAEGAARRAPHLNVEVPHARP